MSRFPPDAGLTLLHVYLNEVHDHIAAMNLTAGSAMDPSEMTFMSLLVGNLAALGAAGLLVRFSTDVVRAVLFGWLCVMAKATCSVLGLSTLVSTATTAIVAVVLTHWDVYGFFCVTWLHVYMAVFRHVRASGWSVASADYVAVTVACVVGDQGRSRDVVDLRGRRVDVVYFFLATLWAGMLLYDKADEYALFLGADLSPSLRVVVTSAFAADSFLRVLYAYAPRPMLVR
ncbi:hypothetical protein SPRG_14788 [Saprolegnia parasitica CBS 223.65]|uniref:Uncharacterized protein n=1 Tax=Saprolegnia parasitica (strain CBS 223.65) TaxID=695850 RepID=A0A067BXC5_SAPPC|nr:hypothetical protein SPRG_14788 [Saprolegnia parasitica CBS 223.65]KDO19177.1 hypothetical protein SPRG_14788 [Saprolegnia parasitica CBS 223.65]|eukprot:XP_012210112.1 hypothetical protein SPRG_14788 [Saprolegnia parasitica CBS 223.65]